MIEMPLPPKCAANLPPFRPLSSLIESWTSYPTRAPIHIRLFVHNINCFTETYHRLGSSFFVWRNQRIRSRWNLTEGAGSNLLAVVIGMIVNYNRDKHAVPSCGCFTRNNFYVIFFSQCPPWQMNLMTQLSQFSARAHFVISRSLPRLFLYITLVSIRRLHLHYGYLDPEILTLWEFAWQRSHEIRQPLDFKFLSWNPFSILVFRWLNSIIKQGKHVKSCDQLYNLPKSIAFVSAARRTILDSPKVTKCSWLDAGSTFAALSGVDRFWVSAVISGGCWVRDSGLFT